MQSSGRRKIVASVGLAFFIGALLLPGLSASHAQADADLVGSAVGLVGGHVRTQVEPVHPAEYGQHCAICHWLRDLGSSTVAAAESPRPLSSVSVIAQPAATSLAAVCGSDCPARAPPQSHLV